ncbi:hypothetical protein GCM10018966_081940 [Streptomyces yanii]
MGSAEQRSGRVEQRQRLEKPAGRRRRKVPRRRPDPPGLRYGRYATHTPGTRVQLRHRVRPTPGSPTVPSSPVAPDTWSTFPTRAD